VSPGSRRAARADTRSHNASPSRSAHHPSAIEGARVRRLRAGADRQEHADCRLCRRAGSQSRLRGSRGALHRACTSAGSAAPGPVRTVSHQLRACKAPFSSARAGEIPPLVDRLRPRSQVAGPGRGAGEAEGLSAPIALSTRGIQSARACGPSPAVRGQEPKVAPAIGGSACTTGIGPQCGVHAYEALLERVRIKQHQSDGRVRLRQRTASSTPSRASTTSKDRRRATKRFARTRSISAARPFGSRRGL
jgi:hypothetical protein